MGLDSSGVCRRARRYPFVGSGTTIIAAEMTGRACHAIELQTATLESTGEAFEAKE
jgi:hypothetical protein